MKSLKSLLLPVLALSIGMAACGGKDDDPAPGRSAKKVQFKATGSTGVKIMNAVYGFDQSITTASDINAQTWQSAVIDVPGSALGATCVIGAVGPNASSTLKVEMYIDGQLKKTGTSSGTALSAGTQIVF